MKKRQKATIVLLIIGAVGFMGCGKAAAKAAGRVIAGEAVHQAADYVVRRFRDRQEPVSPRRAAPRGYWGYDAYGRLRYFVR